MSARATPKSSKLKTILTDITVILGTLTAALEAVVLVLPAGSAQSVLAVLVPFLVIAGNQLKVMVSSS